MAAIPTPTNGFWNLSLWDDFGGGWDVLPAMRNPGSGIKRFEQSTPGSFGRQEVQRFEQSTPGSFHRIDE